MCSSEGGIEVGHGKLSRIAYFGRETTVVFVGGACRLVCSFLASSRARGFLVV